MTKIMLIDDDESLQTLVGQIVRRDGHDFCFSSNGEEGLHMLRREKPDLLILDVMLPDINGFEICQIIRAEKRKVPIIFLTAKGDIVDKSIGFKVGGDDYLVKPFQAEELSLRITARLRRRRRSSKNVAFLQEEAGVPDTYRAGDLKIYLGKYKVSIAGEEASLSSREFKLLELLASDPGNVFTRDQILTHVWGDRDTADPNSVTVFVRKIREKIEKDPSKPQYLITVWRVGYKLADS